MHPASNRLTSAVVNRAARGCAVRLQSSLWDTGIHLKRNMVAARYLPLDTRLDPINLNVP